MVGKRRSIGKKANLPNVSDSLVCIYCHERVSFGGSLPATEYESHLGKSLTFLCSSSQLKILKISILGNEHKIRFDIENVIDRTLTLQRPNMMLEKRIDVGIQVVSSEMTITKEKSISNKNEGVKEIKTEPGTEQPVLEVKIKPLEEASIPYKMVEVSEKRRIPWFAGCEYKCRYDDCEEMFFYNQDLRNHIKKVHGNLDAYLDKFKVFETKDEYIACKECFLNLKRHFSSVFLHLRDKHDNMTILEYAKKHKMKDYDKTYKVMKKQAKEKGSGANSPMLSKKRRGSVSPAPSTESKKSRKTSSRTSTPVEPLIPALTRVESPSPSTAPPIPVLPPKPMDCPSLSTPPINNNPKPSEEKSNGEHLFIQKPWFSGCEYECQLCSKIFFELNELLFHVRNQHNMTAKPYQKKFYKFETRKAFYQCKLCFSKIKHTKTFITNHLAANHNSMKLNAYEEVFHPSNGSSSKVIEDKSNNKSTDQSTNEIVISSEKFKDWARGTCQFQCKVCGFTTGGSVDFWKHVKNTHDLEIQVYKDTHGNPCIVMNKIICKGCQRVLRYDYGTLLGHASTKHNMTLIEFYNKFYKKFIEGNLSPTKTKDTTEIPDVTNQLPVRNGNEENDDETKSVNLVPMLQRGGSDLKKRAHLWGWRCQYKCAVCSRSFSSRVGIQKHVNLAHNVSLKEYIAKYGSTMTKKVHHACLICEQKVLHDPSAIAMHIRSSHKMTYEDYYVRYVEGGRSNGKTPKTKASLPKPVTNGVPVQRAVVKPIMNLNRIRQSRKPRIGKTHHSGREEHFKWAHNAADYKCKLCSHATKVMNTFQFHIKTIHGLPIDQYRMKYGPLAENTRKHTCKICSTPIVWRANNIISHLNGVHANMELSLKDYYYVYIKGGLDDSIDDNSASTDAINGSWDNPSIQNSNGEEHLNVSHELNVDNYSETLIPDGPHNKESEGNTNGEGEDDDTHTCLICSQSIELSTEAIEAHLQTHNIDFESYEKRFRDQLDEAENANNPQSSATNEPIQIENVHGEDDDNDDDDDFGSVFEDEDEENELDVDEEFAVDPLASQQDTIQTAEDIDDIDIEENVDYITDAL